MPEDGTGAATITDNDQGKQPALSIGDAALVVEGVTARFPVRLSAAVDQAVTVAYATADGTAPAQQRPFFGAALRDPLLAALRDPLLAALRDPLRAALRDPLLAALFDPLLGPLPNLFRQHRAHLLQPRQPPGLLTPETPRQQHSIAMGASC